MIDSDYHESVTCEFFGLHRVLIAPSGPGGAENHNRVSCPCTRNGYPHGCMRLDQRQMGFFEVCLGSRPIGLPRPALCRGIPDLDPQLAMLPRALGLLPV